MEPYRLTTQLMNLVPVLLGRKGLLGVITASELYQLSQPVSNYAGGSQHAVRDHPTNHTCWSSHHHHHLRHRRRRPNSLLLWQSMPFMERALCRTPLIVDLVIGIAAEVSIQMIRGRLESY